MRALVGFVLLLGWVCALTVSAQKHLPSVLARYEMRRGANVERLHVLRLSDHIEHRYPERGLVEIWERDARGELSHWKVFDRLGRSVHYTPGDLRTVHLEPNWEALSTLLDPDERKLLAHKGTKHVNGQPAAVLEGKVDRHPARVLWDEPRGLLLEMVLGSAHGRTKLRLLEVQPCTADLCTKLNRAGFRELEFADLGDSENDPFVRTFLARFSSGHTH